MDYSQYYNSESDYLKASDLAQGKKYSLTIKAHGATEFDDNGKKSMKAHVTFIESDKKFTLNKTNYCTLTSAHTENADNWIGKQIFIYRTMTQFGDKMVDCLRIELPMQEATLGQPEASMPVDDDFNDHDIPFNQVAA